MATPPAVQRSQHVDHPLQVDVTGGRRTRRERVRQVRCRRVTVQLQPQTQVVHERARRHTRRRDRLSGRTSLPASRGEFRQRPLPSPGALEESDPFGPSPPSRAGTLTTGCVDLTPWP